jgi:hypothetical protein
LIDWLVEVAEEYKLMQETLYTTVKKLLVEKLASCYNQLCAGELN